MFPVLSSTILQRHILEGQNVIDSVIVLCFIKGFLQWNGHCCFQQPERALTVRAAWCPGLAARWGPSSPYSASMPPYPPAMQMVNTIKRVTSVPGFLCKQVLPSGSPAPALGTSLAPTPRTTTAIKSKHSLICSSLMSLQGSCKEDLKGLFLSLPSCPPCFKKKKKKIPLW